MNLNWIGELTVIDRSLLYQDNVWHPFAIDELLSDIAAREQRVLCHLWCHESAVILGQRDSRLPYIKDVLDGLEEQRIKTCVRHSGGAAVPLDKGVLNISLIFPIGHISERSYNEGFEKMYELLSSVCKQMPYTISKGEIKGAYCPGDYDLSINGLKFCGIAQRRKVKSYIVQAFVNIEGDSVLRGELIKRVYATAVKEEVHVDYPHIIPQTLTSLAHFGSFHSHEQHKSNDTNTNEVSAFVETLLRTVQQIAEHNKGTVSDFNRMDFPSEELIEAEAKRLEQRYSLNH